ncbi:MAG TPA: LysE family transporter [Actinomycetes bacterium]|nr:LysE family transporter [Actinomycetes bacterium]
MTSALLAGYGVGLLVALQVGPIFLLCARTSARFGFAPGAAIGGGAATVDLLYAALGALGASVLLRASALRLGLGLLGAGVLAYLGIRTLHDAFRVRIGGESDEEVFSTGRAFRTALAATASNPLTILTWAAVFSGAAVAQVAGSTPAAVAFVVGTGLGSLTTHLLLAGSMAAIGARLDRTALRAIDVLSGVGLVLFAGALGWRSVESSRT